MDEGHNLFPRLEWTTFVDSKAQIADFDHSEV